MKTRPLFILAALMPLSLLPASRAWSEPVAQSASEKSPGLPLINVTQSGVESRFSPSFGSDGQIAVAPSQDSAAPGVVVTIQPGKAGYPGVNIKPEGEAWDLSAHGHVEARIVNTGEKTLGITLRVDENGDWHDSPWNTSKTVYIKPGATGVVNVIFGYSYGKPGYALKPANVGNVLLFCGKSDAVQSFRVESIEAGGPADEKPPVDPASVRIKPKNGYILGGGVPIDATKQVAAKGGATASLEGEALKLSFAAGKSNQYVSIKPAAGRWDLREAFEVRVKVKNDGTAPVTPKIQVSSNGGPTDLASAATPLAPGAEGEVAVTFASSVPWLGIKDSLKTSWNGQPNTGTKFTSDTVSAVNIMVNAADGAQSLLVESIKAGVPAPEPLPDWVGKRPPVEGEWVKTFDEEFDGDKVDETKWNVYADNFWDKRSHFSKDNVVVKGGVAKLHYEKKTGYHNDDPSKKKTDYATGFLDTYGKWVQRYGYFEARMKLTSAPGLWPAFWLMPDRGVAAGPQWKRASTNDGAMEFDIMEFLGRWGGYRYNIAMHWDGYGKTHQQTGSTSIYFLPDKDGYITAGLLWTPGLAVYYANGKEVLRWESPRISNVQSDIMFTNVTGGWDNDAIDDSKLPDDFVIDYVRAWQRKDLASDVDGKPSAAPKAK